MGPLEDALISLLSKMQPEGRAMANSPAFQIMDSFLEPPSDALVRDAIGAAGVDLSAAVRAAQCAEYPDEDFSLPPPPLA